jgi:hypothetical protein
MSFKCEECPKQIRIDKEPHYRIARYIINHNGNQVKDKTHIVCSPECITEFGLSEEQVSLC